MMARASQMPVLVLLDPSSVTHSWAELYRSLRDARYTPKEGVLGDLSQAVQPGEHVVVGLVQIRHVVGLFTAAIVPVDR
jgi:hypothetical protein